MNRTFKFGAHVRHLDLPLMNIRARPLGAIWCPNLRSLKIEVDYLVPASICDLPSLAATFHACPNLIAFDFVMQEAPLVPAGFWESEDETRFMCSISRLRLLRFDIRGRVLFDPRGSQRMDTLMRINQSVGPALEQWHAVGPRESQIRVLAQAPNLKHLTIDSFTGNILNHPTTLRFLRLPNRVENFSTMFPLFLAACPLLDELDLVENCIDDGGFDVLWTHRPLELLRAARTFLVSAAAIARYLTLRGSRLRRLTLPAHHSLFLSGEGGVISAALIASAPRLTMVDFGRIGKLYPAAIVKMADQLPHLRVVGIRNRSPGYEGRI
ncbi:hypothetical protein BDK51DRAFT_28161 [Blyttiomyces helicus]|uniref:F-box domain-containing protein n=1 Tax=Blyttiomyces helicus TaxID=388810 RepID=A0A4P9WE10_9FUNG|nr:hypothetical protein BDK51DRAFT_28161 [Blyttiomyces helicus]|eukprot:RKO90612.1 hypothetical protein BDK51DRAFT_28161 [Blyttiomyces helicus]